MLSHQPKDSLRAAVRAARAELSPRDWEREDAARMALWRGWLSGRPVGTLAAYAARPGEPGTNALLDEATAAGWRVLLPVLRREPDWAEFDGWAAMRLGPGAIPEPTTPRLGAAALARASIVVVPCLAVALDGTRLGTGGGWYDRALPHRRAGVPVLAWARRAEVHSELPAEPHDLPVDAWLTEAGWLSSSKPSWLSSSKPSWLSSSKPSWLSSSKPSWLSSKPK